MWRLICVTLVAATVTVACATTREIDAPVVGVDFTVSMHDNPIAHRFDLRLTSHSKRKICLPPEQWPNQSGKVDWAKDYISVRVGAKRFPIADWNGGYCPGCYVAEVRPGESVAAFIPYADFENFGPENYQADKELTFPPHASWCYR